MRMMSFASICYLSCMVCLDCLCVSLIGKVGDKIEMRNVLGPSHECGWMNRDEHKPSRRRKMTLLPFLLLLCLHTYFHFIIFHCPLHSLHLFAAIVVDAYLKRGDAEWGELMMIILTLSSSLPVILSSPVFVRGGCVICKQGCVYSITFPCI